MRTAVMRQSPQPHDGSESDWLQKATYESAVNLNGSSGDIGCGVRQQESCHAAVFVGVAVAAQRNGRHRTLPLLLRRNAGLLGVTRVNFPYAIRGDSPRNEL